MALIEASAIINNALPSMITAGGVVWAAYITRSKVEKSPKSTIHSAEPSPAGLIRQLFNTFWFVPSIIFFINALDLWRDVHEISPLTGFRVFRICNDTCQLFFSVLMAGVLWLGQALIQVLDRFLRLFQGLVDSHGQSS